MIYISKAREKPTQAGPFTAGIKTLKLTRVSLTALYAGSDNHLVTIQHLFLALILGLYVTEVLNTQHLRPAGLIYMSVLPAVAC